MRWSLALIGILFTGIGCAASSSGDGDSLGSDSGTGGGDSGDAGDEMTSTEGSAGTVTGTGSSTTYMPVPCGCQPEEICVEFFYASDCLGWQECLPNPDACVPWEDGVACSEACQALCDSVPGVEGPEFPACEQNMCPDQDPDALHCFSGV